MTALAAQESGLDKEFISDINRNSPDMLHDLYLSTKAVQHAVTAQNSMIRRIAENGSCVIVGRAADYILRGHPDVVRVFIYAPPRRRKISAAPTTPAPRTTRAFPAATGATAVTMT